MSAIKSVTSSLNRPIRISRKHLSRYSWLPDVLRLEGSVTLHIIGPVLTVTVFATLVAYAWHRGHNVTLTNSVTPLLSVVVGLILVFRNGTSYDRYYEGRKDFGAMMSNIRNLSRLIWISVALPPDQNAATQGKEQGTAKLMTAEQLTKKKIYALKLAVAYAYAVKHHLRDENGIHYQDYEDVLPDSLRHEGVFDSSGSGTPPMYASYSTYDSQVTRRKSKDSESRDEESGPSSPIGAGQTRQGSRGRTTRGHYFHSKNATLTEAGQHTPLLADDHRTVDFHSSPYAEKLALLPLAIAHELARVIFRLKRDGYLETLGPAGTNTMNTLIQGMVEQLTNMQRVANTPIPVSYGIHLKQCVTLYLFALPFTLVHDLQWSMIPIVTVVAFTLMGIEGIANEIEMPFGDDSSDLPLDHFCKELKDEISFIIERLPEGGEGMHGYDDGEGDD